MCRIDGTDRNEGGIIIDNPPFIGAHDCMVAKGTGSPTGPNQESILLSSESLLSHSTEREYQAGDKKKKSLARLTGFAVE